MNRTVLVPGRAGDVGSVLVPKLIRARHRVRVVDLSLYGDDVLAPARGSQLDEIRGDVRDVAVMRRALISSASPTTPASSSDLALARSIDYDAFLMLLDLLDASTAGWESHAIAAIAQQVHAVVVRVGARREIEIITSPTEDVRSYHISSERIKRELGFEPRRTISDAVRDLVAAFADGRVPNPLTDLRYHNIKTMQLKRLL